MNQDIRRMRPLLGTFVEIGTLPDGVRSENAEIAETAELDFGTAFGAIERVQTLLSFHTLDSELTRLNHSNGEALLLDPMTVKVLRLARATSRASLGLFNPTVGGELQRLGFLPDHSQSAGFDPLPFGDATDIEIRGRWVRLRRPIRVVLDGIAKGFAVDCAIEAMKRQGLTNGWVNAGGDIRVFGDLTLPIQIRDLDNETHPLGGLRNAAIATSRVSKEFSRDFPGWIVSPGENEPVTGLWSVLANTCWRADALTKVASLADDASRDSLIRKLGGKCVQGIGGQKE